MINPLTTPWVAEITWNAWTQHRTSLAHQGLSSGAPAGAADIDSQIAESATCPTCTKRMRYFPMSKPGEYRAFAVCLGCNVACEF